LTICQVLVEEVGGGNSKKGGPMAVEEVKEVSPQAEKVKVGSGLSFFEEG
jgi:hypothetical protein